MGKSLLFFLFFFFFIFFFIISSTDSTNSSCPVDLSYVHTLSWDKSSCMDPIGKDCCTALRNLIGVALALNLKDTSLFQFPNETASAACLSELQAELTAFSINPSIVSTCYPNPNQFSSNASSCAGIITLEDWKKLLGPSTELDSGCKNFSSFSQCSSCVQAGFSVNTLLISKYPNSSSKCFYFAVLYAAGILNDPTDEATASCILRLPLSNTNTKNSSGNNNTTIKLAIGLVCAFMWFLLAFVSIILYRKWRKKRKQSAFHSEFVSNFQKSVLPNSGAKWFHPSELEQATNGFSQINLIGQGASGIVYKGTLADGTLVAVKQIMDLDIKGDEEFTNEVEIISKIRHKNLLSLIGCCVTSDDSNGKRRFLVYDYMPNGTLSGHISNTLARKQLTWPQRKNMILDVARGIAYLHYGLKPAIFHRDIKSSNILLDSKLKAKVADFGLAKQSLEGRSHQTTRVAGTFGYLAPEYALYGQLTEKSDVYSFGIVILELMSGMKVLDTSTSPYRLITDWAWTLAKSGKVDEILDEFIKEKGPRSVMERFVKVGILCAHMTVDTRPTITDALKMLEGDIDIPTLPDRPSPIGHESVRSPPSLSYNLWASTYGSIPSTGSAMSTISIV